MTKGMGNITNVFAMGKGTTESPTTITTTPDTAGNYTGNFLEKALYRTPLNPLLCRGNLSEDFADFQVVQAASTEQPLGADLAVLVNATAINSYEIHKTDNTVLSGSTDGINQSHEVKTTFTLNSNTTANSGDTTGISAGMSVTGTNIPASTTVSSVTNTTTFVLSASATGSGATELTFTTQTYSSVNRKYPNSTTVSDHLSNLQTTRGNVLKTYDYDSDSGQRLLNLAMLINDAGHITNTQTTIVMDGYSTAPAENDVLIINNEEILVTNWNGGTTTATVIRGYNNTIATAHSDNDSVFKKDSIDSLWVLVYSDDPNTHHFAKVTEILEHDVWGDAIEFTPSLKVDIPKDTKFAIFSSHDANLPKIDSDNQTLVACGYGLQSDAINKRHYLNTHVSKPFFYFLNGKDRLEPATRYTLRSSSYDGSNHTYTYSTFLTDQEYSGDIIDYSPYTMEATLVDMMYKADNPAAMNFLEYTSDYLSLTNGSPDTIFLDGGGSNDVSFDGSVTAGELDGTEGTTWHLNGILRDSRFTLVGAQTDVYCLDSATDSTATTLTMDAADFTGVSTSTSLIVRFLAHSVDLDHNKMYCSFDSTNHLKNAFRMAHRPNNDDGYYHAYAIGQTRYLHYNESPLTNSIAPNVMEMNSFESITQSGGYVDMTFADTQKILTKKLKEGDNIYIHKIISNEETGVVRNQALGTFNYNGITLTVDNLESNVDIRFTLGSSIPKTSSSTTDYYDPLYDAITVNVSGTLYHIIPDRISNVSGNSQRITVRRWRKDTDTEYTTGALSSVPNFSTTGYRKKYSFLADNMLTSIDIDSNISSYSLDYDGDTAQPANRNVTNFENFFKANGSLEVGDNDIEKSGLTRINDINLVLRGGMATGHRVKVEYGDSNNNFLKLKTHLKDERFMESYNKTDYLPYADRLSNVSLYGYEVNSGYDPQGSGANRFRYDLARSPSAVAYSHVRGVTSYLDYFKGNLDIERRIFKGTIESIEQLVEDGMFKLKLKGRDETSKLLGPVVNKDFKFTEDIVYSTIGPVERMALYGYVDHATDMGIYEVGTTVIRINKDTNSLIAGTAGDLLFTSLGVLIGRIYSVANVSTGLDNFTLEEGIPTRLKDHESIMISSQFLNNLSDITTGALSDTSDDASLASQFIRGNTVSFSKAMSSNPYTNIRVNSLSGAGNKGIIFNGGNSLNLSVQKAPVGEGSTLIGTSSSPHPLAKGYSINSPDGVDYDLPFYCHLADEITDKYTVDYVNLHTVNSLTNYDIINVSSKDSETTIEVAPICPAVLGRIDDNPLDSRDKQLITVGAFPETVASGYNGIFQYPLADWIEELNEGDFIFDSNGNLFGKIIDFSVGSNAGLANDRIAFTLDRPLFKSVTSSEAIYKYYSVTSPPQYFDEQQFTFYGNGATMDVLSGGASYSVSRLLGANDNAKAFLAKLEAGMRIYIEGHLASNNNGVFTVAHVFKEDTRRDVLLFSRKQNSGHKNADDKDAFDLDTDITGDAVKIKVLTDYFTQGLYFLNTQGLGQGGVVSLVDNYLSSPNKADDTCKPIKWANGLYHYITDLSITTDSSAAYNPNADGSSSAHEIFSDMVDRYGNFKWRYFGLQKGKYLSYINRRRKDGQIKDAYTSEKGRVNGYATAYRISDAKFGKNKLMKYPYGYHNNDFAWSVRMYDDNANAYVDLFETTNDIKEHPYFLEYLSPESRDFRPVMGSNFADFPKHGTNVTSPEHVDYNVLNYPRFMPRLHDNFRGGDWSEDLESPLNSDIPKTILQYRRWKAQGSAADTFDYGIVYGGGTNLAFVDPSGADGGLFATSLEDQWVKLSGWPDRNNNRSFYLKSISDSDGSSRLELDITKPPFSQIGTQHETNLEEAVGGSEDATTGHEEISVLYPPWIGPKFDGITRAKDHWELPDPKTLRWFIFSPSDMYPDSMSRKNHIGYSANSVSRSFTDYNLLLKGESSFTSSDTLHEYYEGSLEEEQETDNQYESLSISDAIGGNGETILPSQIKRFGLMRLVDCTYDWHFNLIDPERLPNDMSKLNTPNFEYTRYQPLKRLNLTVTSISSGTLTVSADPTSLLKTGDQIFTDKGYYLGKVDALLTSANRIDLVGSTARQPILKADGTVTDYHGYVYVCGDGVTAITTQDFSDSFYRFQVKGRAGKNTFISTSFSQPLNMLQQMWNGMANFQSTTWTGDKEIFNDSDHLEFYQIPYGVIDDTTSSSSISMGANGWGIDDTDYQPTNKYAENADADVGITESQFLNHFNKNFLEFTFNTDASAYSRIAGFSYINPLITLPPAFRCFYSTSFSPQSTGKTINAMQEKKFLVSKTQTPVASGVIKDGTISADATTTITVKTVDATTKFSKGDVLYDGAGAVVGLIYSVASDTSILLYENNVTGLGDGENLHLVSGNEIQTEYTHPSNILEWNQLGGNPYIGCEVISLGRYEVEDTVDISTPIGGRTKIFNNYALNIMENFPHSKPARTSAPSGDSAEESLISYGDGFGKATSAYGNANSFEYTFLGVKGNFWSGYTNYVTNNQDEVGYIGNGDGYVADGVYGVFHPILHIGTNRKLTLTGGDVDESRKGIVTFDSINGNTKEGVLRLTSGPTDLEDTNAWLNFVDLTGMYLVGNIGTTVGEKPTRLDYAPFNGDVYDLPSWAETNTNLTRSNTQMHAYPDIFFMTVTTTSGSAVVNYGPSASGSPANPKLEGSNVLTIYGGNGTNLRTISSVDTSSNQKNFTMSGTASASGTFKIAILRSQYSDIAGNFTDSGGFTSMANTMVDPNHIIYVKEHRRNITGKTVAHELLIDNVPHNLSGAVQFFDNYRVMRPAETCLWRSSPEEIDMYKLSSQTTKMPQENKMYGNVPPLLRVHSDGKFAGPDINADERYRTGEVGENEAVMSMYMAIDMDSRHSQYKSIGTVTVVNGSSTVTSSSLFGILEVGDVIKITNQLCYVKSIEGVSSLTIAGKYVGASATPTGYLFNNTYTVLRDYIHLFNPTGNRNTFKSGSAYTMLLTDGVSKQKISMGVDADYYDDRALCKLSIGKIENDMLGIVSFGETFLLKSNQKTKTENYTSAKIGSTVVIGQEVEDVINNLLSSEDVPYDIKDDREYPYYISPNYQGIDIFSASNFAAKYKQKELRIDETGISLIKQTNLLDYRPIELNYETNDFKIISVTRNKSTFDVYNEIIVYGNGIKALKRNRKSIDRLGKKTLEDVNMELTTQDDVDSRAKSLLSAHSDGEDRFTVKMTTRGIDFLKAGDLVTLDFPAEGIDKGQYKVYEIRREITGLIELEVGTYRKDLANRFAELSIQNKSNAASIRGSQFKSTTAPLDFFGSIKLKELRLVIRKISLSDSSAFTLGFQTLAARKLDFGTTMGPQETITTIITEEDFI